VHALAGPIYSRAGFAMAHPCFIRKVSIYEERRMDVFDSSEMFEINEALSNSSDIVTISKKLFCLSLIVGSVSFIKMNICFGF
jgi:hypothetical protein